MHLLIIGYGDIGLRVARLALAAGHSVATSGRRDRESLAELPAGVMHHVIDLDRPETLTGLSITGKTLLYLAPPPAAGRHDPRVQTLCSAFETNGRPAKIVYASTSGVYGDCAGALVDESRPPNPQTDRAFRRLDAERSFQTYARQSDSSLVILRIAGIYGPGRLPLQRLAAMKILPPQQAPWSNRIHADDLARICLAACERAESGAIFNVCDGEQSTMSDYFLAVARTFNLPEPAQIDRQEAEKSLSPEMLSYLAESRRLDNRRLREELGIVLQYPTLAEGLQAIHSGQEAT